MAAEKGAEHLAEAEIDGVAAGELLDVAPVVRILLVGLLLAARREPQLEARPLRVGLDVEIVGDDASGRAGLGHRLLQVGAAGRIVIEDHRLQPARIGIAEPGMGGVLSCRRFALAFLRGYAQASPFSRSKTEPGS